MSLEPLFKRRPVDELQHEGPHAGDVLEAVNGGDVGVIERREEVRLAREPRQAIGIARERVREDLQRDVAMQPRVVRPIDFAL